MILLSDRRETGREETGRGGDTGRGETGRGGQTGRGGDRERRRNKRGEVKSSKKTTLLYKYSFVFQQELPGLYTQVSSLAMIRYTSTGMGLNHFPRYIFKRQFKVDGPRQQGQGQAQGQQGSRPRAGVGGVWEGVGWVPFMVTLTPEARNRPPKRLLKIWFPSSVAVAWLVISIPDTGREVCRCWGWGPGQDRAMCA